MNIGKPLWWVDIGMAIFVAVFLSIVLFVDGDMFNRVMFGYVVALVVWAFLVESAAMRSEKHASSTSADEHARDAGRSEPLSH